MPIPTPRRANTILYCRDWAATVEFYRDRLGLPVTFINDWFIEFQVSGDAYLSIADATRASIAAVEGKGITLAWQVDPLDEVWYALQKEGIVVTPIRRRWSARAFYCHDPEGHRLEFWSDA